MPRSFQNILRRLSVRLGFEQDWYLVLIAAVIGLVMGCVATAFILPLHWLEEQGKTLPREWLLILVPLAPIVGALLTGWINQTIKGDTHSPGVATVLLAVHRHKSRMLPTTAIKKWLASTMTIGSGGSAGAEGPIVTIGSAIGSTLARWLRVNPQHSATLLGCGAGAGIASVFNAPIAGIFFVLEILLRDFSLRTFTPIVIASVISAAWTQTMLGSNDPLFSLGADLFQSDTQFTLLELPNYLILGLLCGVMAAGFIRLVDRSESLFQRLPVHRMLLPAVGASLLGVIGLMYLLLTPEGGFFRSSTGVPEFYGNGYPFINLLLAPGTYSGGEIAATSLLLALVVITLLKMAGTCCTIGSGGSGGLFAPSLHVGAGLGAVFGLLVIVLPFGGTSNPAHYALVGMAAMLAAATHAPLTAILIVYELTRSYEIILPLMFAAIIATILARIITRDSMYTIKLTRQGVRMGRMSDLTLLRRLSVADVPLRKPVTVRPEESAQRLLELSEMHGTGDFIVVDDRGLYLGLVTAGDLRTALLEREAIPLLLVNELQRSELATVTRDDTLDVVLDKFSLHDVSCLAVLDAGGENVPIGVITRDALMRTYQRTLIKD